MAVALEVTLYGLFLGDQDATTGQFDRGYSPHVIKLITFGTSATTLAAGMGVYSRHNLEAFTNYSVDHGDIIKDAFDNYYVIASEPVPQNIGDEFIYYKIELQRIHDFPFTVSDYFGFERIDETHKFEDGFERGYWVYS